MGGRIHFQDAPRIHIHLGHVAIASTTGGIGVKDDSLLIERGRRRRTEAAHMITGENSEEIKQKGRENT